MWEGGGEELAEWTVGHAGWRAAAPRNLKRPRMRPREASMARVPTLALHLTAWLQLCASVYPAVNWDDSDCTSPPCLGHLR